MSNLVKANETCMKLLNMLKMVCPEGTEMPIGDLTVGMFQNDKGKAKMRLKAAEGRYLLPLVVLMFQNLFPTDTPHATLRLHCLHALNNCYKIIREWQTDGTSTADLRRESRRFLMLYGEFVRDDDWAWYPKFHIMAHAGEDAQESPAVGWNYLDESEIGIAVLRAKGRNQHKLCTEFLQVHRDLYRLQ